MKRKPTIASILTIPKRGRSWFDRLPKDKQEVALEVKDRVNTDGLDRQPIARNLIEALELSVSVQSVSSWLKQ